MKRSAFLAVFFAMFGLLAEEITVSDVTIAQNPLTRLVTVDYKLDGEPAIVTVDFMTNNVSIGEENFRNVFGDVNRVVDTNGVRRICWRPYLSWAGNSIDDEIVTAKVTAWTKDDPPDYLVVDFDAPSGLSCISYYVSTNALPDGGLSNDVYRTSRIVMRRIKAAGVKWLMGNDGSEKDTAAYETPHYVMFTEDYYLGIFEVTQEQHRRFSGENYKDKHTDKDGVYGKSRENIAICPRVNIEYRHLRGNSAPINKYGTLGVDTCHLKSLRSKTGIEFDLPTDAQWEYAARAGGTSLIWGDLAWSISTFALYEYYYGNSPKHTEANGYPGGDGVQHGSPVGSRRPNGFGIYDMLGNVCEICRDAWKQDLGTADATDPLISSGSSRVRRGGNFNNGNTTSNLRATYRTKIDSNSSDYKIGYRLMCPLTLKFPVEETAAE